MRTFLMAFVVFLWAGTGAAFEGVIHFKGQSGQQTSFKAKLFHSASGNVRAEFSPKQGQTQVILAPADKKAIYVLLEHNKTYLELPEAPVTTQHYDSSRYVVKNLGKDKVAGHKAVHVRVTDTQSKQISELWIASKIAMKRFWKAYETRTGEEISKIMAKHKIPLGLPLKMTSTGPDGKVTVQVTKLENKSLSKNVFSIPPGYQQTQNMVGAMLGEALRQHGGGLNREQQAQAQEILKQLQGQLPEGFTLPQR